MLFRYSSESAILESILRYKKVSIAPCASNSTQCYLWIIKSSIESLTVRQNGEMHWLGSKVSLRESSHCKFIPLKMVAYMLLYLEQPDTAEHIRIFS